MNFPSQTHGQSVLVESNVEKLDSTNAPELKSVFTFINKNGVNKIVLDLSQTKYCDSSGLSAILIANRLCKDTNGEFILSGLQSSVRKMIEIAQLDKVLVIVDNKEAALNSFE
jgi:anti-sigma B factor antagonist